MLSFRIERRDAVVAGDEKRKLFVIVVKNGGISIAMGWRPRIRQTAPDGIYSNEDYEAYKSHAVEDFAAAGVAARACCLMPSHIHLALVPSDEDGLRRALGEAHRRYTRRINFREGWRGYLWQGRFASFAMDDSNAAAAIDAVLAK